MSAVEPKIYFHQGVRRLIGPLGYFPPGDELVIDGRPHAVGHVDLDGMACAWDVAYLTKDGAVPLGYALRAVAGRSTANVGLLNPQQVEDCKGIAAVGQRLRSQVGYALAQ